MQLKSNGKTANHSFNINFWSIVDKWRNVKTKICVNIVLLPDSTKPLPEPKLIFHKLIQWLSHESNFLGNMILVCKMI